MKACKFKGEVLSPIHIGAGEEIEPFDYSINNGLFYRISLDDVILGFSDVDKDKFYNTIESGNINNLRKFIVNRTDIEKHSSYCCQVSSGVEEIYREKFDDIQNQLLITPFIKNEVYFLPYIPGSSIKGAIRTAVLSEMAKRMNLTNVKGEKGWEWKIEGKILENQDVRGNPDAKKDPFRAIKIKDVLLPEKSTIITQIKNVSKNSRGHLTAKSMQLFYEVVKSKIYGGKVEFTGEILIDDDLQRFGNKGVSKNISIEMIKKDCNAFYRDKLEMEHRKFYQQSEIESNSNLLLKEEFDNNSFLLRLGRFSGVESVTLDNYREPRPPGRSKKWGTSRTICEGKYPMGWVKITLQ